MGGRTTRWVAGAGVAGALLGASLLCAPAAWSQDEAETTTTSTAGGEEQGAPSTSVCQVAPPDPAARIPIVLVADADGPSDTDPSELRSALEEAGNLDLRGAYVREGELEGFAPLPASLELAPSTASVVLNATAESNQALNGELGLGAEAFAFVRTPGDLEIPSAAGAAAVADAVATGFDAAVAEAAATQARAGALELEATPTDDGGYLVDVTVDHAPAAIPVDGATASLGNDLARCAPASLPFTIASPGGPQPLTGTPVSVAVGGVPLDTTLPAPTEVSGGTTSSSSTPVGGATGDGDGEQEAEGSGGSSGMLFVGIGLVLVALALVGVVVFTITKRKDAPTGDDRGLPPPGTTSPPSPHGPSPTSGVGIAAPVAAAVAAAPTGRAVEPPAIDPLVLPDPAPGWTAAVPGDGAVRLADLGLMRIRPVDRAAGRTWELQTTATVCAAGWLEKRPGKGEDAEPTLRSHENGRGLIAVYDGTGGAGSAPARTLRDGTELTGAYVASRLARDLTESWYAEVVASGALANDAAALRDRLAAGFRDEAAFVDDRGGGLKGSLSRVLPTTMAAIAYGAIEQDGRVVSIIDALWAGDSRAYVLSPAAGLQVLTVDDTRETDALALIRNDQPMDNLVSADRPFDVHHLQVRAGEPVVLLVATDGCFGYVRTPAHLEYLVLRTLLSALSPAGWSNGLLEALEGFTADDASFAMVGLGYERFEDLQQAFAERYDLVAREHWEPFVAAEGDAERIEQLREESWQAYADRYHARVMHPEA